MHLSRKAEKVTNALGNALGDSIASANGQSSGVPGPVGAVERATIMGYFADGPGTGPSFADDMAMRRAANNPMGLPTSGTGSPSYGYGGSEDGITNWRNNVSNVAKHIQQNTAVDTHIIDTTGMSKASEAALRQAVQSADQRIIFMRGD